jgi:DNA helicase-2/ATP-dependent DNA helicase PcrA
MDLSTQQKAAVEYIGSPALVVAGAGSGKTRTLTAKLSYLISKGYDSKRILAITFTNKAAEEMKTRLVDMTRIPLHYFPWVRTYHSACFKILKVHCPLLGFQRPLEIYAEYQQQKTLKDIIIGELNLERKHISEALNKISRAKNSGDPITYFDRHPRIAHAWMLDVFNLYQQDLKSKNAVDFDDILLLTRNLLRDHQNICNHYQKLFQYILVDEYQDTNNLQEELTRLLISNGNLFCVGDDWQAIYSFRGSNIGHFFSFKEKYPDARIFRLEQNYRSTDEIVQIANQLIGNNRNRVDKSCFSDQQGGLVEIIEFFDDSEEADWVAQKATRLNDGGIPYDQMVVLYRTKFCSLSFEKAFRTVGIAYQLLGGKGFFDRKEILDLNCYLIAATFEKDDAAFERIINTPKRGVGPGTLGKIRLLETSESNLQEATHRAIDEKILSPKISQAIRAVLQLLEDIKEVKPENAIQEVLTRTNYLDYLKAFSRANSMDFTAREENIEQLIYSASQKDTIIDYLEDAALIKEDKEDGAEASNCGLNLSTIHAAKGLEYQVVFVAACEENLFPHWKSMESNSGLEEERRLMYVAVTRSERYLFLSCAGYRKGLYNPKSRFLNEIEDSLALLSGKMYRKIQLKLIFNVIMVFP